MSSKRCECGGFPYKRGWRPSRVGDRVLRTASVPVLLFRPDRERAARERMAAPAGQSLNRTPGDGGNVKGMNDSPLLIATYDGGMRFVAEVRGHRIETDQPEYGKGEDSAPMPLEPIGASL